MNQSCYDQIVDLMQTARLKDNLKAPSQTPYVDRMPPYFPALSQCIKAAMLLDFDLTIDIEFGTFIIKIRGGQKNQLGSGSWVVLPEQVGTSATGLTLTPSS